MSPIKRTALPGPVTTALVSLVLTSCSISSMPSRNERVGALPLIHLAGDQDSKWEVELPNASDSCRSFALWDGMSTWPSIWRLAPDVLSTRSLDLAVMDMKLVAVN